MNELKELKHEGHRLLNQYIVSTLLVQNDKKHFHKKTRQAYKRLAQELRTDAFKCHFGNMHTIDEVKKAIDVLKSWQEEIS
jgi:hypothetical protein